MLENSELKKNLDCAHKDQMEKEEKTREEIAEYQLRLQEAEKKHQALLLDTNKQVKTWGLFPGGAGEWCVGHNNEACFARRSIDVHYYARQSYEGSPSYYLHCLLHIPSRSYFTM